jgi:hypothetical protein
MNQKFGASARPFPAAAKCSLSSEIGEGSVLFYAAADPATLDKEVFSHTGD